MTPGVRRFVLATHLSISIGWFGAAVAYVALDIAATTGHDPLMLRSAYLGMDLIVRSVIAPLAIAALVTGLVMSLGTRWGLLRHWWVVISLILTLFAVVVLLVETRVISALALVAADPAASTDRLRSLGGTLVHSVGGLAVLLVILVLNVYKPRGLTPYGWRKQQEERREVQLKRRHGTAQA
jgi:hypothetical protein